MRDVQLVVLDEVHYLGDPGRGSVWEEVIISCPVSVPLLCMSATVRNPDDLGGWIQKVLLTSLAVHESNAVSYSFCSRHKACSFKQPCNHRPIPVEGISMRLLQLEIGLVYVHFKSSCWTGL